MLGFVAKVYRGFVNAILVLTWIGFAVGGAIMFYNVIDDEPGVAFGGFLVGGIIGFIIVVLTGGYIANFLNMVDNIEKIANKQTE